MNDLYLKDIILNFMIAGKDTSANTLSWFFYMLCKHPFIQEKVAQEVREAVKISKAETTIEEFVASITDETLEKVHYLHAALTETLRLFPAVPIVSSFEKCNNFYLRLFLLFPFLKTCHQARLLKGFTLDTLKQIKLHSLVTSQASIL